MRPADVEYPDVPDPVVELSPFGATQTYKPLTEMLVEPTREVARS
jgi:hypothetical protein